MGNDFRKLAKHFFVDVYQGRPAVVDELAADDIVATYPIFTRIFDTPVLRGREAYKRHAVNFSQTWKNGEVVIHDELVEGNTVVLVWSFQANLAATGEPSRWGGITLIRFDDAGKVVAEIGEESDPGPQARLLAPREDR